MFTHDAKVIINIELYSCNPIHTYKVASSPFSFFKIDFFSPHFSPWSLLRRFFFRSLFFPLVFLSFVIFLLIFILFSLFQVSMQSLCFHFITSLDFVLFFGVDMQLFFCFCFLLFCFVAFGFSWSFFAFKFQCNLCGERRGKERRGGRGRGEKRGEKILKNEERK